MAAQAEYCIVPFMKSRILAVLLSFSMLLRQVPVLQNNWAEVVGSGEKNLTRVSLYI